MYLNTQPLQCLNGIIAGITVWYSQILFRIAPYCSSLHFPIVLPTG